LEALKNLTLKGISQCLLVMDLEKEEISH
jgi:hypothetical protein